MTCKDGGCLWVSRESWEECVRSHWSWRMLLSWDVMKCHDVIRRTVRTFRDAERTVTEGRDEKTNQVCEHYSARKLCFKCEKLWKAERMLRVGASRIHNGPKKEAAGCKWTLQQLELKVTMSGSGPVGDGWLERKAEICRTQREFIWVYYESHHSE